MHFSIPRALWSEKSVRNVSYGRRVLNTTTVNIALGLPGMVSTLTAYQLLNVRLIAICASGASITVGLISIFIITSYDRRKRLFRHELIMFLIVCDFLKALILLIYPVIILANGRVYATPSMINTLGWFTQFATEGSDFAIMFFAIHFALLIFKPSWKWRNKKTGNIEGGLYKYKKIIWPTTFLVPSIMASLVFIDYNVIDYPDPNSINIVLDNNNYNFEYKPRRGGYKPWSAWCYLPARPLWYKYVLSWGPRYILILTIIAIYCSIYIYVLKETRKIKSQMKDFGSKSKKADEDADKDLPPMKRFTKRCMRSLHHIFGAITNFFWLSLEMDGDDSLGSSKSLSTKSLASCPVSPDLPNIPDVAHDDTATPAQEGSGIEMTHFTPHEDLSKKIMNVHSTTREPWRSQNTDYNSPLGADERLGPSQCSPSSSSESTRAPTLASDFYPASLSSNSTAQSNEMPLVANLNSFPTRTRTQSNVEDSTNFSSVNEQFQRENYRRMKKKRLQIQKNLRAIFIYPFSYILLWLFPIIADISQTRHELLHGPIMWLTYIDTFIRPMSCFVHSFVFIFKEKPWKYSWNRVQAEALKNKYMLRGEIGEDEIMQLCHSKWGRRGWYYRSTWNKHRCWKHKDNGFKRTCWYIGRFFKCIFRLKKVNFNDNCNDCLYWNRYYYLDTIPRSSGYTTVSSTDVSPQHNGLKFSQPSSLNELPSKKQTCEESLIVKVPWFWRFIHNIPMLYGIDLDELNRSIKLSYTNDDDDFVIPGLSLALNNDINTDNLTSHDNNIHNRITSSLLQGPGLKKPKLTNQNSFSTLHQNGNNTTTSHTNFAYPNSNIITPNQHQYDHKTQHLDENRQRQQPTTNATGTSAIGKSITITTNNNNNNNNDNEHAGQVDLLTFLNDMPES
ncbi:Gpr1p KNAG_0K01760 [Huiozyma naganishii CBS 8797]|uniref:G-protein coupled receptors family 1 profile domain-containing protein n=1 Tax=Huiozyma naganishii (strain ATCC MYA-139 / BCRC 22969 / CBS 8797 / KCTC 17520 / NBRC 10181 / NCYC 3082 / Yp74L-3) TaxID=1071383 RepID=J7SAX3_HUIN7|nr:hypothetical protein KNAG_0K01760 [Kazachstania naganishii CBS 8797]CCK72541.1 hypothetical protein KNAG_0K01760 [Kazachstania naganishii CBS 8797]